MKQTHPQGREAIYSHQNEPVSEPFAGVATRERTAQPRHELELLTEAELAALLKVCRRQLYKWRIAGIIPSFKLGRAVRFRASEVLAALERHRAS